MKFELYLNEETKLVPMKVKRALDLILNQKFSSNQETFKTGSVGYVLSMDGDKSANQSTAKPWIKKVIKKLEALGFVKTEEHPKTIRWRPSDEIWIKDDIAVLIYLSLKDEVAPASFSITIYDLTKTKKQEDNTIEKSRRWIKTQVD